MDFFTIIQFVGQLEHDTMGTLKKLTIFKLIINMTFNIEVVIPFIQKPIYHIIGLRTSNFNLMLIIRLTLLCFFKVPIASCSNCPTKWIIVKNSNNYFCSTIYLPKYGNLKKTNSFETNHTHEIQHWAHYLVKKKTNVHFMVLITLMFKIMLMIMCKIISFFKVPILW